MNNKLDELEELANEFIYKDEIAPTILKLLAVVKAGREVIDFVNPMFIETDVCLVNLKKALAALEEEPT